MTASLGADAALLDVNVLVALAWPNHVHHDAAVRWFTDPAERTGWATTPITQSGFMRVSSNRRVVHDARSPAEAALMLRKLTDLTGHEFWPDDVEIARCPEIDIDRLTGYRQITDAHLLALAVRYNGRLATFDTSITQLADDPDSVILLSPTR